MANYVDAINDLQRSVDEIASSQIPTEYVKEAVDDYVDSHSGGFATETEINTLKLDGLYVKDGVLYYGKPS